VSAVDPSVSSSATDRIRSGANSRRVRVRAAQQVRRRSWASLGLLMISLATAVLVLADVHDAARFILGITVGLFVPGWAIVGWLKLRNPPLEISISVGASLALLMVSAQILITIGEWHVGGLEVVTCCVCAPSLLLQARPLWISPSDR